MLIITESCLFVIPTEVGIQSHSVIPAKAGIQRRKLYSISFSGFPSLLRHSKPTGYEGRVKPGMTERYILTTGY